MITCPAITPTVDDDSPEHSSATANTVAAIGPSNGPSVWGACSIVVTGFDRCANEAGFENWWLGVTGFAGAEHP